jgi:hypothetical protein
MSEETVSNVQRTNRRRMAWTCLICGLIYGFGFTVASFWSDAMAARADKFSEFGIMFLLSLFGFVGAYAGMKSFEKGKMTT